MTKLVKIDQSLLKQARALTGSNTLQTTKSNYVKISYDEDSHFNNLEAQATGN